MIEKNGYLLCVYITQTDFCRTKSRPTFDFFLKSVVLKSKNLLEIWLKGGTLVPIHLILITPQTAVGEITDLKNNGNTKTSRLLLKKKSIQVSLKSICSLSTIPMWRGELR